MLKSKHRGTMLMGSVAGLGLALALTPLVVSLCHSLSRTTSRGGHRLLATRRGAEELERLRATRPRADREFTVPELPQGRGTLRLGPVTAGPGGVEGLRRAELVITWDEHGRVGRAEWVTLVEP